MATGIEIPAHVMAWINLCEMGLGEKERIKARIVHVVRTVDDLKDTMNQGRLDKLESEWKTLYDRNIKQLNDVVNFDYSQLSGHLINIITWELQKLESVSIRGRIGVLDSADR